MIEKQTFKKAIAFSLINTGFIKTKGQSWFLHGNDAIIVINLQKSNWDELYYINIGIWLKALGEASFPSHNTCHLNFRAEGLFPKQRELIINSCSLAKSNIEYLNNLATFIDMELLPFLHECTKENQLKEFFSQGLFKNGLITSTARNYLSIQ